MKKIALCFLLTFCASKAQERDYYGMLISSALQLFSLHAGSNTNLNDSKTSFVLGGSVGWNYIFDWDYDSPSSSVFGLRLKYLYTFDSLQMHSAGGIAYWYIPVFDEFLFPFALTLGGGTLFHVKNKFQGAGGYAEAGISLWKALPVNLDILYRVNIYNHRAIKNYGVDNFTHNLSAVFTFF